ncbi:ssDNA endodeoxyribonuclease RAD2 [Aspergillus clavatus NRRL 1]|uniref:DNA excision repair protein Rad2 n=1 Tax=Aspergillus clavatus (strain ATCC 1007 / CBS 513.65 / DSM 816 / NCTC 3887 / NRRL 1 / QM 1276 / 107) TaxID=344612 RepID=A1CT40_ASPCL|nr:DNA excision repair protein Rad2 [Aspergillus clavatus NRRL 1]EAW06477.1 DNA excision repair protein Rad2 [Aspergillus clavatus NRRL 1]
MGVTGLWTVVQPCARPIKLETLNKKRLAVDASIWIYQFLKAVRDKEGNALRNSHVVGFFRRICKLLYFGIKPVFVFDGGAPVLKRETIAGRRKRREGRREDAVRTAGKLLAVQMQRSAEEEAARRKNAVSRREEEEVPDNPVYVEETFLTEKEKRQGRTFRKKDAYHLPDLQVSLAEMGAPNDPRIMSREELEDYARHFHQGEDINLYDFSKIDFDSPFFISLPATDRYNILNAARLRSRLRMGYSKQQLDNMFPDRMAFSRFQIERVKERNDLTQRLMNLNGMNGEEAFYNSGQRIAGERGKEYVLVQDSAVEGGWVLGVVGNKGEGRADKPIDVDQYGQQEVIYDHEEVSDGDDGGFEDVPIEGLNRLPKLPFPQEGVFDAEIERRRPDAERRDSLFQEAEDDALFVPGGDSAIIRALQHRNDTGALHMDESDDEDLQRAIAMSLEPSGRYAEHDKDMSDIAINRNVPPASLPKDASPDFAESEDDEMDFAAALAQSRRTEKGPSTLAPRPVIDHPFEGPLPFESIKLNPSKVQKPAHEELDDDAGGFEKEPVPQQQQEKEKKKKESLPLPPWFSGGQSNEEFVADKLDNTSLEAYRDRVMTPGHQFLKGSRSPDVIDVDQIPEPNEVIDLEAEPEEDQKSTQTLISDTAKLDGVVTPPTRQSNNVELPTVVDKDTAAEEVPYEWEASDDERSLSKAHEEITHTHVTPSPEPEFEDVTIQPEARMAEITVTGPERPDTPRTDQVGVLADDAGEFSDPEDEELMRQLAAEGEEHVRFAATLNTGSQAENAFDYEQELQQLRSQQKKDRRDADEVTQVMITECQQLLRLFGLPYVTAPMEAEAQCAELVSLGLVDGIITDDSDIFLFGGTRVYKNMFNQSKYVECYLTSDMEKEYALQRRKLISFAHLLGSDYTEGISGIGPVTALEILTEFSSLEEFRDWWTQIQTGMSIPNDQHAAFYKKFRKTATKIFLPPSFPDARVDTAYLEPEVDSDPSPFQWGVPDLHGLRDFLMTTIGWSQERTDEILVPVIRDMNRREQEGTQANITSFFTGPQGAGAFAPRVRSGGPSRMEKAFGRLRQQAGVEPDGGQDGSTDEQRSKEARGKTKGTKRGTHTQDRNVTEGGSDEMTTKKRKTRRRMNS